MRHKNKESGVCMGDSSSRISQALSNHRYLTMRPKKITIIKLTAAMFAGTLLTVALTTRGQWENQVLKILMQGPLDASDPRLLEHVRQSYLVPPSVEPYNLREDSNLPTDKKYMSFRNSTLGWQKLHRLVVALFEGQPPGFFVEAGALDGEYLSNTVYLEREKGWSGLLVEPDGDMFALLLTKQRRAWASHCCLATSIFPSQTTLVKMVKNSETAVGYRAQNMLVESIFNLGRPVGYQTYEQVQCLPLQTLLLALGVTHVHFVSLDTEGVEEGVARAFLGGGVAVDVWLVEHHNPFTAMDSPHEDFIQMFVDQGYSLYTIIIDLQPFNYVFVRRDSQLHDAAFANRPAEFSIAS